MSEKSLCFLMWRIACCMDFSFIRVAVYNDFSMIIVNFLSLFLTHLECIK